MAEPSQPTIKQLADQIQAPAGSPTASLRIATVTAVESGGSYRVQTDATGATWLSRDADTLLTVGDRVWIVQQGAVWLVGGRLTGGAATPVGVINAFAGAVAPPGWLLCDGSAVSRTTYAALFTLLGTVYGAGDGSTTFNLPNLTNRVPVASGGSYSRGSTGGAATVTLATTNLPAHTHGSAGAHTHDYVDHAIAPRTRDNLLYDTMIGTERSGTTESAGAHTHASVGDGTPFNNMIPYLALPYIIRAL